MKADTKGPPKHVEYTGDPRWLKVSRELIGQLYYQVPAEVIAHAYARKLEEAYTMGRNEGRDDGDLYYQLITELGITGEPV